MITFKDVNISNVGSISDKVAETARQLAKATRLNAEAILAIAEAIKGAEQSTGVYFGPQEHHYHGSTWRGEGFYPAEESDEEGRAP